MIQQCVLNQSQGYWLLLDAFFIVIAFVCKFLQDLLGPYSNETQDFDGKFHMFQMNM
jgi:hypothetical protein